MTTNEPDDYQLIEKIVALVDAMYAEAGAAGGPSAYDYVLDLAEPAINASHTERERKLLDDIAAAGKAHYGHDMWPEHWDVVLDEMDEIGDAAND